MRVFFFFFFAMLLTSCGNDSGTAETDNSIDSLEIQLPTTYRFPELTKSAREAVFEWKNFQELENNMAYINQGNLKNIASETERMKAIADTLVLYPPRVLKSVPIISRMRVLRTRIYLLNQVLHQRGIGAEVVEKNLEEANLAYYNLLLQINEKFEKDEIDAFTRTQENIMRSQSKRVKDSF
jgi:hypothetical protein